MKFNFDKIVNREGTNTVKYDLRRLFFGTNDVIPMWVADMEFEAPPCVTEALIKRAQHKIYGYTLKPESYFQSIINWLQKRHDWDIKKEWISSSPGVVSAVTMSVMAYTNPGDKIIVQTPVYFPFFSSITNSGRVLVNNQLQLLNGKYEIDFDDLEKKINNDAKMLVLCSPHNPGGRVWTKQELQRIGELCVKNNVVIVSDEIHSDLILRDYKHIPIASISKQISDITITLIAPSKTFNVAGLSTSVAICSSKELMKKYNDILDTNHIGFGNIFGLEALEAAYTYGEEWLEQLIDYVQDNINFAYNFVAKNMPKIKVVKPEATFLIWFDCRNLNLNDEELTKFFVNEAKVGLNVGNTFGKGGEGFMRMNVACPQSLLLQGLERIKVAYDSRFE
ncbi:MAG: putative C-S lyase [Bacteroidetes bacterium]|nr:putative C-S lyase [Bacteroidota bacterium]